MTSIKPRLNSTHKGCNDDYHLVIQVIRHRQKREINTPYRLYPDEFDPDTCVMLPSKHHRLPGTTSEVNRYIVRMVTELTEIADDLYACKGDAYTANDIASAYRRRGDLTQVFVYADSVISGLQGDKRDSTAGNYRSACRALEAYLGHRTLSFSEFTSDFVDNFARYLDERGNHTNTKVFYLKHLRAIYNRALRAQVVRTDLTPFCNQTLKEEETSKLAAAPKEIQRIANAGLSGCRRTYTLVRDLFMFSFHAQGMAFVDMCRLKRSDIQGDFICYHRKKTGRPVRIFIGQFLRQLLNRYADPASEYLLPMLREDDSYNARRNIQRKLNQQLHDFGLSLRLRFPLKFYVARHSWATIARNVGVPMSVISEGMGHSSEKTTHIYLASIDPVHLKNANRLIAKCLK